MTKLNQKGGVSSAGMVAVFSTLLLMISLGFGIWAFLGMQDYKNNSDQKAAVAVEAALEVQQAELEAQFREDEKKPFDEYVSPVEFGSVKIVYPRTWSAYVDEQGTTNRPVDAYFSPGFVPVLNSTNSYALRLQILDAGLDRELKTYESAAERGDVTISAYRPKNVDTDRIGYRVDGEFTANRTGAMVLIPLRDKTIKIWTESPDFVTDLDEIVLENLDYQP